MRFTGVSFFAFLTMCFCNNVAEYSNLLEQPVGVLFFCSFFLKKNVRRQDAARYADLSANGC